MAQAMITLKAWLATTTLPTLRGRNDRGASLVEYALLVGLIAMVCFAAVGFLGQEANSSYEGVGSSFTSSN
jgi:Flp pilus assembly pilin Flp